MCIRICTLHVLYRQTNLVTQIVRPCRCQLYCDTFVSIWQYFDSMRNKWHDIDDLVATSTLDTLSVGASTTFSISRQLYKAHKLNEDECVQTKVATGIQSDLRRIVILRKSRERLVWRRQTQDRKMISSTLLTSQLLRFEVGRTVGLYTKVDVDCLELRHPINNSVIEYHSVRKDKAEVDTNWTSLCEPCPGPEKLKLNTGDTIELMLEAEQAILNKFRCRAGRDVRVISYQRITDNTQTEMYEAILNAKAKELKRNVNRVERVLFHGMSLHLL